MIGTALANSHGSENAATGRSVGCANAVPSGGEMKNVRAFGPSVAPGHSSCGTQANRVVSHHRPLRFQLKQLLEQQQMLHMEKMERQQKELIEKKRLMEMKAEQERFERKKQCSFIMRRKIKDLWQMQSFNSFAGQKTRCNYLGIEIISTKFVRHSFPKSSYYVYVICVKTSAGQWLCGRRYSEFLSFYNDICKRHPKLKLPDFPKKSPFSKIHCKEILEERKKQLNFLFRELLKTTVCREDGFWCFIGVPPLRYVFGTRHENEFIGYNFPSENAFEDECQTIDPISIPERTDAQLFVERVVSVLEGIVQSKGYPDKHLPEINEFVCMTLRTGHVSFSTIIVAFIYLQRLKIMPKFVIGNIHLLWLVALSVSAKFCNDEPIRPSVNQWFSRQVMFSKEEEFLNALNFDLNVTYDQYSNYIDFIEERISRNENNISHLKPAPKPA